MANPVKNTSLFPPDLFEDPDAIAQAAIAENPPAQPPSPQAIAAMPPQLNLVPQSFTQWAGDPVNANKIPERVMPGTPLPSVALKALKTAASAPIPTPADVPPPVDSSLAGSPESQQLFPDAAPAAGAKTPSLEDAVMSGPPNGGAGLTAAAPQSPAPPTAPAGPLSKEDFLAQHPAKLPNAPYVPHGGKLALTGLFAALDNAGAFLDHGTPSVGPGLMRNVQALQEYNQNLPASTAQAQQGAYDEYLKNYGSARQNTLTPITTIGPDGRPMTVYADPATSKTLLPANTKAGASLLTTQIKADSAEDIARLKQTFLQGKVARVIPVKMDNGQAGMAAYNAQGELLHTIPGALPPAAYLPTTSSTQEVKEDGNGGYIIIPKTDTKAANLGGVAPAGAGGRAPLAPPKPTQQPANAGGPGATPPASSGPGAHPMVTPPGMSTPSQPAGAPRRTGQPPVSGPVARPVMNADGTQQGGPKSTGEGYIFDPQLGRQVLATREEAATKYPGQVFDPIKHTDIVADRNIVTNLQDVNTKLGNYEKAVANPGITDEDRANMAYVLKDDKFKAGLFGVSIPVDQFNQMLASYHINQMSKPAQDALIAYYNARESLPGYNYLVTHSGRSNKEQLKLALDAIPDPVMPPSYIQNGIGQFRQNLQIKGRYLPMIRGLNDGPDGNPAPLTPQGGAPAPAAQKPGRFDWNAHPKVQ